MDRPIGYWLKHLDTLLENAMSQALGDLSRREWQVLNATAEGRAAATALAPFDGVAEAVRALEDRGWLADGRLTGEGRAAHAAVSEQVARFRRRSTEGVSDEEYRATVGVLSRMAANVTP